MLLIAFLLPMGWVVGAQYLGPDDGTLLNPQLSASPAKQWAHSLPIERVHNGPLRPGDVVIAINGRPVGTSSASRLHAGDVATYTIVRDGSRRDVRVRLRTFDLLSGFTENADVFVLPLVLFLVSAFVFALRPKERPARVMLAVAVFLAAGTAAWPMGLRAVDLAGGRGVWPYVVSEVCNALMWGSFLYFTLIFPQPPDRLRRLRIWMGLCYLTPFALYAIGLAWALPTAGSPLARLETLSPVSAMASRVIPFLLVVLLGLAYRRTTNPPSRQRLRYVVVSLVLAIAVYVGLGTIPEAMTGAPLVGWDVAQLGFIICPLAISAAILRFGLFDIEVIIKRSLLYGSMTALLVGVSIGALQALNHWLPHRSEWVTLAAGGVIVLLLLPFRASLQRWATRMVYGHRDDPYQVVSQLSRLDAAADPYAALRTVVETLARTLRLSFVAVELATGRDIYETAAVAGSPRASPSIIPLATSGRLLLEVMPGREPFGRADSRLLEDVSRQVGRVTDLVLLNSALRESRARIVSAREEERRRLQRDLHDGIGPSLAAQAMQLEVISTLLRSDPDDAEAALTRLAEESRAMVAEVRRVVNDLRPRALDQFGLIGALRQRCQTFQTREGLALVELRLQSALPELPAAVEVAAFRIATEALTNAARHAHATRCRIELAHKDRALSVIIRDNGIGLPARYTPGVGMTSMRARAVELGGVFSTGTDPSGGTVVSASLPLINHTAEQSPR